MTGSGRTAGSVKHPSPALEAQIFVRGAPGRLVDMRRWLTLRALGLGVLALALMAGMGALGLWQLGAYDKHQTESAKSRLAQPPIALDQVLGRDAAFPAAGVGRPVFVRGRYDPADQFYVRDVPGAQSRYAVVTPMTTATGSMILIVRGSSAQLAAPAPKGVVTARGVLQPSQPVASPLSRARVTDGIRVASVLNVMPRDLYAGYVVLTSSSPPETLPPVRPPLPGSSRWAGIRNLLYAIQWWVFAGFVAFMWWRIIRDNDSPDRAVGVVGYGRPS
jgi:cytochrome oxidase assembly protein ShyY1